MSVELNPYSCETPGNLFVGYGLKRAEIVVGLINHRNYAVVGGHRCGKTSLLIQLQADIQSRSHDQVAMLPFYVNMKDARPRSQGEFFSAIWSRVTNGMSTELGGLTDPGASDKDLFRRISALFEKKYGANWLVVLLVDELDSATASLPDHHSTFQLLRQMFDEPYGRRFRLVATGGSNMAELTGLGSVLNLEAKYLGPLEVLDTDKLIAKGLRLNAEQRSVIRDFTGRHPYLTQALMLVLWETRMTKWSADRLGHAVHEVTRHRFGSFRKWISAFGEHGCAVYRTLASAGGALRRQEIQAQLKMKIDLPEALHVLGYHGVIEDDTTSVRICGLIFRDWFQSNYEIERPALPMEDSTEDPAKAVFVVHGRNDAFRVAMYEFLRALGLHPLEWTEIKEKTKGNNPYIGDILETGFARAKAVVVLLTGDDEARLKEEFRGKHDSDEKKLRPQPRPNVLFEAGIAMGKLPEATVLVQIGELRGMSDIAGRHLIRMDHSRGRRKELIRALQKAGCEIDLRGNDVWVDAGNFPTP